MVWPIGLSSMPSGASCAFARTILSFLLDTRATVREVEASGFLIEENILIVHGKKRICGQGWEEEAYGGKNASRAIETLSTNYAFIHHRDPSNPR